MAPDGVQRIVARENAKARKRRTHLIIWLMAVIAVCLAPAVHPIAADVILTALAVWAMRNGR